MGKDKRTVKRAETQYRSGRSGAELLLAGAACLAVGLTIGYYMGRISSRPAVPPAAPSTAAPVMNPSDFIQQEAALKAALTVKPGDLVTLIRIGNLYYDNSRFQDAIDYYGRALEQDPNNVNVRTDRGSAYWSLGLADPAIAEFRRSLEVNPTHPQTLFNLGVVYYHGKNDAQGAREVWEKLLASNPDYPESETVREMISSLSGAAPAGASDSGQQGIEDLLERMKKRP